jgi:hypothetical protein
MSDNGNPKGLEILGYQPIKAWPWPRIVLYVPMFSALPFADRVFYQFMRIASLGVDILEQPYGRTDVSRNKAVEAFMEAMRGKDDPYYTHILMLDADHVHPLDIVQRLAKRVIEDPERLVVGGLNYKRTAPFTPCAFVKDPEGGLNYYSMMDIPDGLVEVDMIGTGCILIHRNVFEQISKPYFYYEYAGAEDDKYPTEDIGFSRNCQKEGVKLWCDTTVTSPHMGEAFIGRETHEQYWKDHPDLLEKEEILNVEV